MNSLKHRTLHERLSEQPRRKPVNKQAALVLHSAQPEFENKLDPNDSHIESDVFIQPYSYEDYVDLFHPNQRKAIRERKDHSGAKFGKVTVLGVYLPDFDGSIPVSRRYEPYYEHKAWEHCPTCRQRTKKRKTVSKQRNRSAIKWVCRCNCGNYRVITSNEASRRDEGMSCSACDEFRLLKERNSNEK